MFGRFAVALFLAASPVLAQDAPPAEQAEGAAVTAPKPLPYKLKKVCRAHEVVGSSIPRMVCSTKRVLLKPGEVAEADPHAEDDGQPQPPKGE
jgi:hypothetical protein